MRELLRLMALLAGFVALPVLVVLTGSGLGFTVLENLLAAAVSLPLSAAVTLIVHSGFVTAGHTVAEVRAS